jgi:hypothetical protein
MSELLHHFEELASTLRWGPRPGPGPGDPATLIKIFEEFVDEKGKLEIVNAVLDLNKGVLQNQLAFVETLQKTVQGRVE